MLAVSDTNAAFIGVQTYQFGDSPVVAFFRATQQPLSRLPGIRVSPEFSFRDYGYELHSKLLQIDGVEEIGISSDRIAIILRRGAGAYYRQITYERLTDSLRSLLANSGTL